MKDEISGNKEKLVRTLKFDKSESVVEPIGNIERYKFGPLLS